MKAFTFIWLVAGIIFTTGCTRLTRLRVYEKNVQIPAGKWDYNFHPSFEVNITDTSSLYNIYVTIRHTNAYRFSNIWLLITTEYPGQRPVTNRVEIPLADPQGNWMGSGMDDIFFHRVLIQQNAIFNKIGTYRFSYEQDMRQNPLQYVMSAGLRIEKGSTR